MAAPAAGPGQPAGSLPGAAARRRLWSVAAQGGEEKTSPRRFAFGYSGNYFCG